jgi:hypothetical protein
MMAKVAPSTLEVVERLTFILESTTYRKVDMMENLTCLANCSLKFIQGVLCQLLPWAELALQSAI